MSSPSLSPATSPAIGDAQNLVGKPKPKEYQFKVLVIGDPCVGKTSIVNRYVHGAYSTHYQSTVGVDFALKVLRRPDCNVRMQLRDIAGQERSGTMTRVYYKDASAALVVFDISRWETLESVRSWKRDLDAKLSSTEWGYLPAVLLANKSDLPAHSRIQEKDLDRLAQEENFAAWFLTSAKDDLNITEAADFLADRMINRFEIMRASAPEEEAGGNGAFMIDGKTSSRIGGCSC